MRDWIIAKIFRHKCPVMPIKVQFAEMGPGKANAFPAYIDPERYELRGFDPKGGMELGPHLPQRGKSSTLTVESLATMELNRIKGDLLKMAEQYDRWGRENERLRNKDKHELDNYWLRKTATEQFSFAYSLRQIAQGRQ